VKLLQGCFRSRSLTVDLLHDLDHRYRFRSPRSADTRHRPCSLISIIISSFVLFLFQRFLSPIVVVTIKMHWRIY
jgi:hypothetical protein